MGSLIFHWAQTTNRDTGVLGLVTLSDVWFCVDIA